jgi:uncharacterized phage protein gp47/JayE
MLYALRFDKDEYMSLTATGLERPRLAQLKADLDQSITDVLGPVNVAPDAVLGQIDGINAAALDDVWEAIQDNYDSMYPDSAEGVSLDRAVAFLGLVRIPAAPVVVTTAVYGTEGTVIPVNALAHADVQYFNTSQVTITKARVIDATVAIAAAFDAVTYTVTLNGVSYSYLSGMGATKASIAAGLRAVIGAAYVTTIVGDKLKVTALDGETPFPILVTDNLTLDQIGSPAIFVSIVNGARGLPIGALSNVDTPVFGWSGIYNFLPGAGSRDVESDIDLRLRHVNASRATGSATVKAIRARLLAEVPGVTAVSIYENRTSGIVNSMPPHSFETIVQGGVDQLVGNNIWENKPAGIETYGNVLINVEDDNGDLQATYFSRPVAKYLWIRVAVTALNSEEDLPINTVQAIKEAVLKTAKDLTVGEDVINQRFIGPIYAATSGIGMMVVSTSITSLPTDTPVYSTSNKIISRSEIATAAESRIEVIGL